MRLIDADELKRELDAVKIVIDEDILKCNSIHDELVYLLKKVEDAVMEKISEQPTIESVPVGHGKTEVGSAVDVLFSHNEIVALWHEQGEERGIKYLLWRGMAWNIPKQYKTMPIVRFFGTIPQSFSESDTINILIELPECGAKMDRGYCSD